jgi:hypothetical protein
MDGEKPTFTVRYSLRAGWTRGERTGLAKSAVDPVTQACASSHDPSSAAARLGGASQGEPLMGRQRSARE